MFNEFEKVVIKATGVVGDIVDIHTGREDKKIYIIEADERDEDGDYQLYDCYEDEIEKV